MMMEPDASDGGDESSEELSFDESFGLLAHHLFPDGVEQADLSGIWPHREDRRPVSFKDARQSVKNLFVLSSRDGLNAPEMWAVTFVACETLPLSKLVTVKTPLVDGTSTYFQSILRCLIPRHGSKITSNIVIKLLGVQCDSLARRSVLRLLAGAFRNGWFDIQAETTLSSLYGVIFSMVFDKDLCSDAVRILYFITKQSHVRQDRVRRMKKYYDEHSKGGVGRSPVAPILLLIHLYANFDPVVCSKYIPATSKVKLSSLYRKIIVKEVLPVKKKRGRPKKRSKTDSHLPSDARQWLRNSLEGVVSWSWRNDFVQSAWKASDMLMNDRLQCLASLEGTGTPPNSEIIRLRSSIPFLIHEEWYDSYRFHQKRHDIDMQNSEDEEYSVSVATSKHGSRKTQVQDSGSQLSILESFVSFANRTGALLPEMELFLVNEILPSWDGTDTVGRILCYELLPLLSPRRLELFETQVLGYFEQFLLYGGPRLQYLILGGGLAALVRRWGRLDWSQDDALKGGEETNDQNFDGDMFKQVTLGKLIQWTDRTILKACLVQKDNHLLLNIAALEFFKSVATLTNSDCPFLIAPSPALVYHFLVSPSSAVVVDGICRLLVDYKGSFQRLKALEEFRRDMQPISGMESVTVFNSFIWDFCNVLWKCTLTWNEDGKDPVTSLLLSHLPSQSRQALQHDGESAAVALSIVQGSLFVGYVDRFCESAAIEASAGIHPSSLLRQGNLKLNYFDFLCKDCGLHGLYAFLTTFAGSLAQRREDQTKHS